jgi:hypothetical protein
MMDRLDNAVDEKSMKLVAWPAQRYTAMIMGMISYTVLNICIRSYELADGRHQKSEGWVGLGGLDIKTYTKGRNMGGLGD